jgi:hypothetical protein
MVECAVELVDRLWSEGVAYLGPIESDAHGPDVVCSVIRDVVEFESLDRCPSAFIKDFRDQRFLRSARPTIL